MQLYDDNFDGEALQSAVPYAFFDGYIKTALWSSNYEENGETKNMDDGKHLIAPEARIAMLNDCAKFIKLCEVAEIDPLPEYGSAEFSNSELSGRDFWLTRNSHGAGYWDRDIEGKTSLTTAAKLCGPSDLYLGDDGYIYC